jgi:hypothetical protein
MTAGAATDAINQRLGATTIVLGDGGPTVTAAQLGAAVDARGLADRPSTRGRCGTSRSGSATVSTRP